MLSYDAGFMRALFVLLAGIILAFCEIRPGIGQRLMSVRPDEPVICYQSFENRPDHVGVPDKFRLMREGLSARKKSSTIEVEYVNFPADGLARVAFEYAVGIWESELISTVPIRIQADWRPLGSGVLGQAVWGTAHANFGGEQHSNVFYPVALAEKISGQELNGPAEPDIVASFNSTASWYFATDGKTPAGKMDMVTIVLHEIAHGLGFTDSYHVEGGQGSVGLLTNGEPVPFVFDVFVENGSKKNLLHGFESPSQALADQLQGQNLYHNSPLAAKALGGKLPELYAPASFDDGSSISHLDETTFSAQQDANRLMTPQIAFAESIHNPGSVLLSMLADMGWVYTKIEHVALKDTERRDGQPYTVSVNIRSDNGYDGASLKLHYSNDGVNFTIVNMTPTGLTDEFHAQLPGRTTSSAYAYYISILDVDGRTFTSPGKLQTPGETPEQGTHFFQIGPDLTDPEISHEPVAFVTESTARVNLTAEVTDNLGLKEVLVEYFVNSGAIQTMPMERSGETDTYTVAIDVSSLSMNDELQYRIIARDLASQENVTLAPADDYYIVDVTGIMAVQESYSNDFNDPSSDFFGANFRIATPSGFQDGAIHSDHPYNNGSGPDNESNYTYQLQIPIRISEINPVMRFDEIVLVEPGENGSVFGSDNFFDYVIVEGSVDGGITWEAFGPGYDSRSNEQWLTRYNSKKSGDDSDALGDKALFHQRTVNMVENGNFFEGDEVLIRFRLFADQLANGWGWAIDNLSIQTPITGVEKGPDDMLKVYPIPALTELFVDITDAVKGSLHLQICDAVGRILYDQTIEEQAGPLSKKIDVQMFDDGFYFLKVRIGDTITTRKFLKLAR